MSSRSTTPVKQIIKDDKQCPGAPLRKTNSNNPGNLQIVIPPFEGNFEDPRAEHNGSTVHNGSSVMCKTPESKVRRRPEGNTCPDAPIKKTRPEFFE